MGVMAVALVACHTAFATILLDDDFNNNDLAINPDTGGGFVLQDNANGSGFTVTEEDSLAKITDGTGNNTVGIRSINALDLSNPSLTYTITWEVARWEPGSPDPSLDLRRIFLSLQTNDSWLFLGDAEESRIMMEIDLASNDAYLRYQNRSASSNTNFTSSTVSLGSLDPDADGFTVTLVIDSTGFNFTTTGLNATSEVAIVDTWANLGTDFATVFGTDGPMHIAAYTQDNGSTNSPMDISRITVVDSNVSEAPIVLEIIPNGANYDFEWNSRDGVLYRLVTSTDLSTPIITWPTYDDGVNLYDDIAPSGTGTNLLTDVIPLGSKRFFAVIEE